VTITVQQVLSIKNHLGFYGYWGADQTVESQLVNINGDPLLEADLIEKLADADTRKAAWNQAQSDADDLTSGEGAVFDWPKAIRIKRDWYLQALGVLADSLQIPRSVCPVFSNVSGNSSVACGWRVN
jgi:hypothetical protein